MSNSSTRPMTEKQTYRRRTVMGALATGSGFAALGGTAFQEDDDEDSDAPTADDIQSFVGVLSGRGDDSEGIGCVQFVPVESGLLWQLVLDDIECVTQAHIHAGTADEDGPIVTPLVEYTGSPDGTGEGNPRSTPPDGLLVEQGFLEDETLREDIRDQPAEYYINVHTVHNPDGEIGGQLLNAEEQGETEPLPAEFVVSELDPSEATVTQGDSLEITATVENRGDITATQTAELRIDGDTVADRTVDLICRESTTVTFSAVDTTDLGPGEHEHDIVTEDGSAAGTLSVEEAEDGGEGSPDESQGDPENDSESESGEDTDEDSQNDSDSESGEDSQENSEEDSSSESGENPEGESGDDSEAESEGDSDSDSEGNSDSEPAEFTVSGVSSLVGKEQGDSLDVSATVENSGGGDGTQTVECRVAGETVDEQEVTLGTGESTDVTFAGIDTADLDPGEYEFGVFSEDDSSTGTLSISEPPEEEPSEFVVVDMTPRNTTVTEGEFFDLSATIENVGGTTGTHFVEMEASIASDAQEVQIAPGASSTVTFTDIDTGGFPTGEQLLAVYTPHDGMTGTLTIEAADQDSDGDSNGNSSDGAGN